MTSSPTSAPEASSVPRRDSARQAVIAATRRAVTDAGHALAAAATEPDAHPRPRRRFTRFVTWFSIPLALLTFLVNLDFAQATQRGVGAVLVISVIGSTLAVALLGRRALLGWRIVAVSSVPWLAPGVAAATGDFAWPWASTVVLVACFLLVTLRYSRAVAWGAWGWTAILLVLGGGRGGAAWAVALLVVAVVVDARRQRKRAQLEAVAEREARARQEEHSLVLEERARIARDLHDVVAHHMSMIAVQAESAPYRLAGLDEPVRAELESIAESARAALSDVRGILTVLRDGADAAERAPQPTLADLEGLVDAARSAGATVALEVTGARRSLLTAVEIGVFRIVQESLANAARHAPGAAVVVHLAYGDRSVEVSVTNEAPRKASDDGGVRAGAEAGRTEARGHGLVGMRERATLLGGEVLAGPTDDGGFRVHARLPLEVRA